MEIIALLAGFLCAEAGAIQTAVDDLGMPQGILHTQTYAQLTWHEKGPGLDPPTHKLHVWHLSGSCGSHMDAPVNEVNSTG